MRKIFYPSLVLGPLAAVGIALSIPSSRYFILERMGFPAPRPTRYWLDVLKDADATTRCDAVVALGFLGPEAGESVPALAGALKDGDSLVRENAALALLKIGPDSRAAVPALGEALEDHIPGVRLYAVMVLNKLGAESRPALPALIRALQVQDNWYRIFPFNISVGQVAASTLGHIGPDAKEAVPTLKAVLDKGPRDKHMAEDVHRRISKALEEIDR